MLKLLATCEQRGKTCKGRLDRIGGSVHGKNGLITRVDRLEQVGRLKDKLLFLLLGAVVTGVVTIAYKHLFC